MKEDIINKQIDHFRKQTLRLIEIYGIVVSFLFIVSFYLYDIVFKLISYSDKLFFTPQLNVFFRIIFPIFLPPAINFLLLEILDICKWKSKHKFQIVIFPVLKMLNVLSIIFFIIFIIIVLKQFIHVFDQWIGIGSIKLIDTQIT